MKKKQYEKPSLEVVVLNHQTALLAGSTGSGGFESDPEEVEMD